VPWPGGRIANTAASAKPWQANGNIMTESNQIPFEFNTRLLFFKNQVNECFNFLNDYNFEWDKEEKGQTENFNDYFLGLTYTNEGTYLNIHFSTDIVNGMKTAFPQLKEEELPGVDSQIICSIWDKNAFTSVHTYAEIRFPQMSNDKFTIDKGASELNVEIARVTKNYSDFFKANLISLLEKKLTYDCYTDRFYDKVFKEIHYR
jgi:hypothetical protein